MEARFEGVRLERGGRMVLDVPALTLGRSRTTAILGPNGAGKTSLLRLLAGLERPTAGRVLLDGAPAVEARGRVGFAFQQATFLRGPVRWNLELGLRLRRLPGGERAERVRAAAELCGIVGLLERDALRLSGGEAQRANLARALALGAELLLLDEPLSGLDGPSREALLADLPAILEGAGATVVLVTHDREEALLLAQELVLLLDGQVAAHGPAGEVFRRPPTRAAAAFLGYTVIGELAVRPGALRVGRGDAEFRMRAARVVDLGTGLAAEGFIATTPARAWLGGGEPAPAPGEQITVSAAAEAVVRFAADGQLVG